MVVPLFLPPTDTDKGGRLFLPVQPRINTYGAGYEQAKQASASRGKTLYAPKALTIWVAASRRHPVQFLSVAKIFSEFFGLGGLR
jgi:hypothetical protein